jgi:hypothetical protein
VTGCAVLMSEIATGSNSHHRGEYRKPDAVKVACPVWSRGKAQALPIATHALLRPCQNRSTLKTGHAFPPSLALLRRSCSIDCPLMDKGDTGIPIPWTEHFIRGMGIHKSHLLRKRGLAPLINAYWAAIAAALVTLPNADWAYIQTICRTAPRPWFDRDRCLLSTYKADDRCIPPGCHLCHSAHSVFLKEGHR